MGFATTIWNKFHGFRGVFKRGFGLMRLPKLADGKSIDVEQTSRMVDAFIEAGRNLLSGDSRGGPAEGQVVWNGAYIRGKALYLDGQGEGCLKADPRKSQG